MQDHLLQPGAGCPRGGGAAAHRVPPQPPLHALEVCGSPEGQLAGGELVLHRAEGEDVAARVVADAEHLFRRHVGGGAVGQAEFLGHQVGQLLVMGEAVVDQHRGAVLAEQDVGRLHVKMDDMLVMQRIQRIGDGGADLGDLPGAQRQLAQPLGERRAGDALHHDVGLGLEAAHGDEARHMHAGQARHDELLHLEGDDGRGVLALGQARHLHQHGHVGAGAGDAEEEGHAALVQHLAHLEAVDRAAGADHAVIARGRGVRRGRPAGRRRGSWPPPWRRRRARAARWRSAVGVEGEVAGRRVAVPRLADGAEHGEPAPPVQQRHRRARHRRKAISLPVSPRL